MIIQINSCLLQILIISSNHCELFSALLRSQCLHSIQEAITLTQSITKKQSDYEHLAGVRAQTAYLIVCLFNCEMCRCDQKHNIREVDMGESDPLVLEENVTALCKQSEKIKTFCNKI